MYIPAAFRETRLDVLHDLIRAYSFGTLVSMVDREPFATHIPFLLDADRGPNGTLVGHMARANHHWHGFVQEQPVSMVIFQGPHAYISPSWYASAPAVPTWNYTVVHAYGTPVVLDDPRRVREILDRTVRTFEAGLPEPWSTELLSDDYITNLAKGIVAFELPIARLEGKRKLGQNRPVRDVEGAINGLRAHGDVLGLAIADLMSEAAGSQLSM